MRRVKCVSPHGGGHHGLDSDGAAVPPGYPGRLAHPPHEAGYVYNAVLGTVPVGDELDAPEPPEFIADGFHFVDITTGQGDVCQGAGDGCWCGGSHHLVTEPATPEPHATPEPPAAAPEAGGGLAGVAVAPPGSTLADLLKKGDA